jgi:CheY-like chemotaxis protein
MRSDATILIAEDDEGHFSLTKKNLARVGVFNDILRFSNGQELLDFLFEKAAGGSGHGEAYVLLLDIRMPKVDGIQVLDTMKKNRVLKRIPVIILTTTDDPLEVDRCHSLGCSLYIVKPVEYEGFVDAIEKVGKFLSIVSVPHLGVGGSSERR